MQFFPGLEKKVDRAVRGLIKNIRKPDKFLAGFLILVIVTSWAYDLVPIPGAGNFSPAVKKAEATGNAWQIRQEINITDGYFAAPTATYATSSAIINIDTTKYSGTATYYLEVEASSSSALSTNIYLKRTTGATAVSMTKSLTTTYALYRSSSFTPTAGANDYVVVIGNESGATKGIKSARVIVIQNFPDTADQAATSTETQIEIGNQETGKSNTTNSALTNPKYWDYSASKWDGTVTAYAEITYSNTQFASTTTWRSPGTFTNNYKVSPGTSYTSIQLWGGGGAGGSATGNSGARGGGGAGGQYAASTTTLPVGNTYTLVVAGTSTASSNGVVNGSDSTFNTNTVVAKGGAGGAVSSGTSSSGGAGSTASGIGTTVFAGGTGGNGTVAGNSGGGGGGAGSSGTGNSGSAGTAGTATAANGGAGGAGVSANAANNIGKVAGGGGSGGLATASTNEPGGNGAPGWAVITETIGQVSFALEEDNGNFGSWTFKQQIDTLDASTSTTERIRSAAFTPVDGRHYRIVASSTNATATYNIYNAKIIVDQGVNTFRINNASYASKSMSVASQSTTGLDIKLSSDGTKLYEIDNTNKTVYQYTLSTAWDVSSGSYASKSFSVSSQATNPLSIFFSTDGSKMYVADNGFKLIYQYTLSTPWDLSTASYASKSFSIASQEAAPQGLSFSSDGTKMYTTGSLNHAMYQYTLGTAWDVSTASYASKTFNITQDTNEAGMQISSDGSKAFILGKNNNAIYQYTLSTPYDVSTASYDSVSFSVSSEDTASSNVVFSADGTKMYTIGTTNNSVHQYTLATASTFSKLEPQYLLSNTVLSSGTGLQSFLENWDSTEWSGVTNTYLHSVDSANSSASAAELDTAAGTLIVGSVVTSPSNQSTSTSMTMPANGNIDVKATSNNNDIYANRVLVQTSQNIAVNISGTVYASEGGSNIGSGKTISMYKNGSTLLGSGVTDSSGVYSVTLGTTIASGDIITSYINGDTTKGVTEYKSDGTAPTNVDIYGGALIVRDDTGAGITDSNIKNGYVDDATNMVATTTTGAHIDLTVNSNYELHVWTGDTYTPTGIVTTQGTGNLHLSSNSTATLAISTNAIAGDIVVDTGATLHINSNITVGGGDITTAGTATVDTTGGSPTVTLSGTGSIGGGSNALTFYNLTSSGTISGSTSMTINNTLNASSGALTLSGGTVTMVNGSSISNSGTLTFNNLTISNSATVTTGSSFSVGGVLSVGTSAVFTPSAGTITMTGGSITNSGNLNFNNLGVAGNVSTSATFGVLGNMTSTSGTLTTSGGTITVSGNLSVAGTITGTGNLTVNGGGATGDGTINLTGGTFNLSGSGTFGGNTGWTFKNLTFGSSTGAIVDSFDESNVNSDFGMPATLSETFVGQAFTANGRTLKSATFYMSKSGSPTGNATAVVYAETHATAYGTDSLPTGAALATSDNFDVSTLNGTDQPITFNFSGANRIALTNGTHYIIAVNYTNGDSSNGLNVAGDSNFPVHPGNTARFYGGSWIAEPTIDTIFYVYSDNGTTYSSGSGSITSATTTVVANQTLDGAGKTWNLTAAFEPFQLQGTFLASTSDVVYQAVNNATVTPTTYYNLDITPGSGSPTFKLATTTGQTITVNNNFTIGGAGAATVDVNTRDPVLDLNGNLTIGTGDTFQASNSASFTLAGNFSNSGTFTHNNGTLTLDTTNTASITSAASMTFYNMSVTTPGKILNFQHQTADVPTFTIANTLTLTGSSGSPDNLIKVQSDAPGQQWEVNFSQAQSTVTFVLVKDSGCAVGSHSVTYSVTNSGGGNVGSCWNIGNLGASGSTTVTSVEQGGGGGTLRTGGRIGGGVGGGASTNGGDGGGTLHTGGGGGGGVGGGGGTP